MKFKDILLCQNYLCARYGCLALALLNCVRMEESQGMLWWFLLARSSPCSASCGSCSSSSSTPTRPGLVGRNSSIKSYERLLVFWSVIFLKGLFFLGNLSFTSLVIHALRKVCSNWWGSRGKLLVTGEREADVCVELLDWFVFSPPAQYLDSQVSDHGEEKSIFHVVITPPQGRSLELVIVCLCCLIINIYLGVLIFSVRWRDESSQVKSPVFTGGSWGGGGKREPPEILFLKYLLLTMIMIMIMMMMMMTINNDNLNCSLSSCLT